MVNNRGTGRSRRRAVAPLPVFLAALFAAFGVAEHTPPAGVKDEVRFTAPIAALTTTVPTGTPTATPTETPTPEPTPEPTPAETATEGPAVGAMAGPAPQAARRAVPGSASGIARISSPTLGLNHYIEVVGVVDGQMLAPVDGVYAVGWYPAFSAPGQPGNVVFSAHETWNRQRGPFYSLRTAGVGTEIALQMTDGRSLRYEVMSNRRYALADMPMAEILWPGNRAAGEQWITLITCGGRIVYDSSGWGEYLDRDVVVAKLVG